MAAPLARHLRPRGHGGRRGLRAAHHRSRPGRQPGVSDAADHDAVSAAAPRPASPRRVSRRRAPRRCPAFADCEELRRWYVEAALPQVGPWGFGRGPIVPARPDPAERGPRHQVRGRRGPRRGRGQQRHRHQRAGGRRRRARRRQDRRPGPGARGGRPPGRRRRPGRAPPPAVPDRAAGALPRPRAPARRQHRPGARHGGPRRLRRHPDDRHEEAGGAVGQRRGAHPPDRGGHLPPRRTRGRVQPAGRRQPRRGPRVRRRDRPGRRPHRLPGARLPAAQPGPQPQGGPPAQPGHRAERGHRGLAARAAPRRRHRTAPAARLHRRPAPAHPVGLRHHHHADDGDGRSRGTGRPGGPGRVRDHGGRRPRLLLGRPPLRRHLAGRLVGRGAVACRLRQQRAPPARPGDHRPRLRARRPGHDVRRQRDGPRHRARPVVVRRARRVAAGRHRPRPGLDAPGERRVRARGGRRPAAGGRLGRRPGSPRADPVGALVRRPRRAGHLPADRPALHGRPLLAAVTGRPGCVEDPRLLRLPAPGRCGPGAGTRPGRHPPRRLAGRLRRPPSTCATSGR